MTNAYLVGTRDDSSRGEWKLDKEEFLIGREAPADLIISLPSVSRRHACITRREGQYFVADLASRNGTFVNGQALTQEPRRLISGDEIVLGGAFIVIFHDPEETMEGARLGRLRGVWIDDAARAVWVDAKKVDPPLSAAQYALLALLYRAPGKIFSRDEIIAAVWPSEDPSGISEEAIDGLIKRLRSRLRDAQSDQEYIAVVRGQGIRFSQPET